MIHSPAVIAEPSVGVIFWKRITGRGWIKHEVRAIVDGQFVYRHWSHRWGGTWAYEVEAIYIWSKVWMLDRDDSEPFVTLDGKEASRLNRKHDVAAKRARR